MSLFLTIDQICELVGCTRKTLYLWRKAGQAPVETRIGGKVLFHKDDVDSWIESRRNVNA